MAEQEAPLPEGLQAALAAARRLVFMTGAGVSAASGVPTFRDAQTGLWAKYRPEDLATPEAFADDPRRVWDWYAWRRELVSRAEPNPAHYAMAEIESRRPGTALITQNVDGLHQRAGSVRVIELHGNLARDRCHRDGQPSQAAPDDTRRPPRCPHCGGLLRPDVVWFGEALPAAAMDAALQATSRCDLFLSVGTSSLVQPAAGLARGAKEAGAVLVEINPDRTPLTPVCDFALHCDAADALPALARAVA